MPLLSAKPSTEAVDALIAHLRLHPEDVSEAPEVLATRFAIHVEFIKAVRAQLRPHSAHASVFQVQMWIDAIKDWLRLALERFDKWTERTKTFITLTFFSSALLIAIVAGLTNLFPARFEQVGDAIRTIFSFTLIAIAFLLQGLCYFRKAMTRFAFYGGFNLWIILTVMLIGANLLERQSLYLILLVPFVAAVPAVSYAALGSGASILGGYAQLKVSEFREERMSRQELLERFFELQERLSQGTYDEVEGPAWSEWPVIRHYRKHPIVVSVCVGLLWSLTRAGMDAVLRTPFDAGQLARAPSTSGSSASSFIQSVLLVAEFFIVIGMGFLSGKVRRGLVYATIYIAAVLSVRFAFGLLPVQFWDKVGDVAWAVARCWLLVMFGALGSKVQTQANYIKQLQLNNQAALVAEMLRIQWRLADGGQHVCVMSVDVARSSQMKAGVDPLAVEYSFREFQDWIELTGNAFEGNVLNTMGDGAILSFPTAYLALTAARRMQTELPMFNRETNRLESPFRVRIGLHSGYVAGELDEVQFAAVIDIAAHTQGVAPVGGISMTEEVATQFDENEVVPLAKEVDGHRIFLAINPTED